MRQPTLTRFDPTHPPDRRRLLRALLGVAYVEGLVEFYAFTLRR